MQKGVTKYLKVLTLKEDLGAATMTKNRKQDEI
jgi:hypothetical protein